MTKTEKWGGTFRWLMCFLGIHSWELIDYTEIFDPIEACLDIEQIFACKHCGHTAVENEKRLGRYCENG